MEGLNALDKALIDVLSTLSDREPKPSMSTWRHRIILVTSLVCCHGGLQVA